MNLRQQTLDNAGRNITRLNSAIERAKSTDAQRLKDEYQRLVRGLQTQGNLPSADPRPAGAGGEDWLANPALPEDIMREAVSNQSLCMTVVKTGPHRLACCAMKRQSDLTVWH